MAKTKIFAALMALCLTFAGCAGGTGTETAGETFTEKPETDSETLAERLETEQEADPGFPTADLYVDYTNGDDGNDGSENSPFKTLTAARDAARKLHDESEETLYVNIWLREGVHKLSETFKLSVKDSYTSFLAYEGESPVVSGGEKIEGWTEGENGIWSAPAKGVDSRDFFVNGNRATRAKHKIKRVSKLSKDGIQVLDSTMATVSKPQYMEFVFKYVWNSSRLRAESAVTDESGKTMFTMSFRGWNIYHNTAFLGGASLTPRDVYYAENAIEFLDEPGEWYLDPDTDKIYYMPLEGEDISKA
ncbi:MAG: hypothetical protein E7623_04400, partial [Ruminococcaceae bacterium]|nr:hypothetical protein [Oscillospiraceae bacterium]